MCKRAERRILNTGQLVLTPSELRRIETKLGDWRKAEVTRDKLDTAKKRFEFSTAIKPYTTLTAIGCIEDEQGSIMYKFSRILVTDEMKIYTELLTAAFPERHQSRSNGIYSAILQPDVYVNIMIEHARRLAGHLETNQLLRLIGNITAVTKARQAMSGSDRFEEAAAKAFLTIISTDPTVRMLIEQIAKKETGEQLELCFRS